MVKKRSSFKFIGGIALLVLPFATGCASLNGEANGRGRLNDRRVVLPPTENQEPEQSLSGAVVRPGFVLAVKVEVQGRWEVDEPRVRVSSEGDIRLPLIGSVRAVGQSLGDLNDHLTLAYAEYYVSPLVTLDFVTDNRQGSSPWGSVTVLGRVKNPGVVALPPTRTLSVIAAIQEAGGFDTSADQRNIRVTGTDTGTRRINLRAMGRDGQIPEDSALNDGDIVYIPERRF